MFPLVNKSEELAGVQLLSQYEGSSRNQAQILRGKGNKGSPLGNNVSAEVGLTQEGAKFSAHSTGRTTVRPLQGEEWRCEPGEQRSPGYLVLRALGQQREEDERSFNTGQME